MKLNLGCGNRTYGGFVNVDNCGHPDQCVDLSKFPWPWDAGSVDYMLAEHWLEHAPDYTATMNEIYRVLKPGGKVEIEVPHFRCPGAAWPQQHINQFGIITMQFLGADVPYAGTPKFDILSLRHVFNRLTPKPFRSLFNWLANITPVGWDMLQMPVESIRVLLRKGE